MEVLLALLGAAAGGAAGSHEAAPPAVCQVAWEDGHLEIEGDRAIQVNQFRLKDPERRILDLLGADLADRHTPGRITVGAGGVLQVRIARHPDKQSVRIVLDLGSEADLTLHSLDGGRRLIAWPSAGEPLGPPAPGSAEAFIGPRLVAEMARGPSGALARPGIGAPGFAFGPPAPDSAEALVGPPAPRSRLAAVGPLLPPRRIEPPGRLGTPPPTPSPDEVAEASGSRSVPWPAAPQVVESIRLRRRGSETTLEIRSRSQLMAWVQDEWQAGRLTVRIPRSAVACDVPRPRGAVSRVALRREEDAWALALDLGDGRFAFDSTAIDGGKGLQIRMRPAPPLNPERPLVVIDPGHGGYDPGALGPGGSNESQVTLDIAKLVVKALTDLGVQPLLTRTMDAEVRLPDRVALLDRFNPVAFVSLHCNSSEAPEATGIETYYRHDSGQKLARSVHERLVGATGRQDRGIRSGRLYVLRGEHVPATLVEMGFISSREEEARLKDPAFQKIVARAIADGIKSYLDSRPVASTGEQDSTGPGTGG